MSSAELWPGALPSGKVEQGDGSEASHMRESISVFFPAYNDEHTIGGLICKVLEVLPECADDYEVIVVNDGSRDGTA